MRRNLKGVKKIVWEGVTYDTVADMARAWEISYNDAYTYILHDFSCWRDVAKWKGVPVDWYVNLKTKFLRLRHL